MSILQRLQIPLSLIPGYIAGVLTEAVVLWFAITTGASREASAMQVLLLLGGGAAGFVFGIMLSPTSGPQAKQFESLGRILGTFLSGVVMTRLLDYFHDPVHVRQVLTMTVGIRLLIPTVSFLVCALCSYMPRAAE